MKCQHRCMNCGRDWNHLVDGLCIEDFYCSKHRCVEIEK